MKGQYKKRKKASHKLGKQCTTHTADKELYPEYIKDPYTATSNKIKVNFNKSEDVAAQEGVCATADTYKEGCPRGSVCVAREQNQKAS